MSKELQVVLLVVVAALAIVTLFRRPDLLAALGAAMAATTTGCTLCRDGWISRSMGKGTCSHHGGIA